MTKHISFFVKQFSFLNSIFLFVFLYQILIKQGQKIQEIEI